MRFQQVNLNLDKLFYSKTDQKPKMQYMFPQSFNKALCYAAFQCKIMSLFWRSLHNFEPYDNSNKIEMIDTPNKSILLELLD